MTENEAIRILDTEKQCLDKSTKGLCKINCGDCKANIPIVYQEKAYELAIFALKEIQQYRKIGTVEECREMASIISKVERNELAKIIDEWLLYKKIGTVEECREAVEKQKPKKPHRNYEKFSVVLPCKIGDTLFCFSREKIHLFKVRCIRIYEERTEIELWYAGNEENLKSWHITISEQDIGYGFFLTREEAEKALKEMEVK